MPNIVQEKFEVHYPEVAEGDEGGWKTDSSARAKKGMPGREGRAGGDVNSRYGNNAAFFTSLPPGTDIEDQEVTDQRRLRMNTSGGLGSGGDRTQDLNRTSLRKGFDKKALLSTDDEYYREHNDLFYDDVGGFVERGNLLDRL